MADKNGGVGSPGLIQELLLDAKENAREGEGGAKEGKRMAEEAGIGGGGMDGLKSRLMTKTARLVLSSQVWLHALPTRDCDLLLTLPPGHPEAAALLTWLIDQIRRKERRLRMEVRYHEQTDTYGVYFSARYDTFLSLPAPGPVMEGPFCRLLKGAELLQLKKRLKDVYGGGFREFLYDEAGPSPPATRQMFVQVERCLRVLRGRGASPGLPLLPRALRHRQAGVDRRSLGVEEDVQRRELDLFGGQGDEST